MAPLEEEVLLVQSNGMAEWLKMSLASHSGVCAATRVELPGRFLWRAYRQVLGRAGVPSTSPLDKTALTWRLMHTLPELLAEPAQAAVFAPVAGFLRAGEADRLFQLAERLADLFDQYQVYRSDWLLAWAAGQDVLLHPARPAQALPADQRWQPALWRALLQPLDETERLGIRPLLHQRFLDALAQGRPLAAPLPRRVVLFGMTHVPLPTLQALSALGSHCQVLLAIPNPCRFHWADIIEGRELLQPARQRRHPLRAGLDLAALPLESLHAHGHPLLAAWGRQGRDFVRQLDAFDEAERAQARFELPRIDLFDEAEVSPDLPLLGQVQAHVRDLLPLTEHPRWPVPADDQSIVFHIAHSIQRELEVLHDRLLALLARPPTDGEPALQPRDVVVMLPDIEPAAPAIRAVFGQYGRGDPRHIPFDIADLSARSSSPLVHALTWVLGLPQQRCSFSELRDLLEVPAVAARIGLAAEDLPQLTLWMEGAGIRWGLNQAQRGALD
ncbi:exodeoxyribonuclease V subunit gamma, partial [Ideonella sp.]|uniref:exodeoxyribonuclease V subunit gamma n=1 Tax=Ideonella sp. TaxID=1929293 RepID=UPI003BB5F844